MISHQTSYHQAIITSFFSNVASNLCLMVQMEKERKARFVAVLDQSTSRGKSVPSLASVAGSAAMLAALSNFQRAYANDPAVQPFLKGLATLMQKQHGVRRLVPMHSKSNRIAR
jgi:hypothetical protein